MVRMNSSKWTQVLSRLAGVPTWETRPETGQWPQAVPTLGKRQKGRARRKCLEKA